MSRRCEQMDAANIERKAKRQRERRCFWSWPPGHCMHWTIDKTLVMYGECCRCGKSKISLPPLVPHVRSRR